MFGFPSFVLVVVRARTGEAANKLKPTTAENTVVILSCLLIIPLPGFAMPTFVDP